MNVVNMDNFILHRKINAAVSSLEQAAISEGRPTDPFLANMWCYINDVVCFTGKPVNSMVQLRDAIMAGELNATGTGCVLLTMLMECWSLDNSAMSPDEAWLDDMNASVYMRKLVDNRVSMILNRMGHSYAIEPAPECGTLSDVTVNEGTFNEKWWESMRVALMVS